LLAIFTAAATLIPAVLPSSKPSSRSSRYTKCMVSASEIRNASSSGAPARFAVTRPVPMPSVIDEPPSDFNSPSLM